MNSPHSSIILGSICMFAISAGAANGGDDVTSRFVEHVRESESYDQTARQFIAQQWSARAEDADADDFLLEGLAVLSTEFRQGLAAFEQERYRDCVTGMAAAANQTDPYLSANSEVYRVKALVALDDLEAAQRHVDALLALPGRVEQYTHDADEMHYLKAYCQLGNLEYADAMASLGEFLRQFPSAPQRLLLSAEQMLAELSQRVPGKIGEVTDLMDYSARRLANTDGGESVQQRQQRVVELLDNLIEEAEQRENSSSGGGGGSSGGPQNPQGGGSPLQDSTLPGGKPSDKSPQRDRRVKPGEAWGQMKAAERERIVQHLKDRFPDRYRHLVEQYYLQLSERP